MKIFTPHQMQDLNVGKKQHRLQHTHISNVWTRKIES
jgi:hypothetical protein